MSVVLEQAINLRALEGVRHGFSTRLGGVSRGELASLNLARRPDEDDDALLANWSRLLLSLGTTPAQLALAEQVHGDRVLIPDVATGALAVCGEGDALVSVTPGLFVAVRTADCVPILLASPRGVAAVHAGWRGVANRIVVRSVEALCAATGDAPSQVSAAVGPHIGAAAYEVSDEVLLAVAQASGGLGRVRRPGRGLRGHVDLGAGVVAQLQESGVEDIEHLGLCTASDRRLYSHRRDGAHTGRLAAVIGRSQ